MARSDRALRWLLADLDAQLGLRAEFKELLRDLAAHWTRQYERCVRLRTIVGIGAITADAAVAMVGNAREFKQGRQMSTWLGLVPTQHSSGGHVQLNWVKSAVVAMRICARFVIQGARRSLQRAKDVATEKAAPEQLWIRTLDGRIDPARPS